jgi:BlaI family penicillinase repressor
MDYDCNPRWSMKRIPRISEAEWTVMRVLWRQSPATANDVVEALRGEADWHPKTVRTLLARLVRKKALGFKKEGRAYLYYPLVDETAVARAESRTFLARVYGGALTPLVAAMIEDEELTDGEVAELRRILDERGAVR